MTSKQFKAQFKHEINNGGLSFDLDMLVYHGEYYGYSLYRLLEKLVLKDGDRYFISSLN